MGFLILLTRRRRRERKKERARRHDLSSGVIFNALDQFIGDSGIRSFFFYFSFSLSSFLFWGEEVKQFIPRALSYRFDREALERTWTPIFIGANYWSAQKFLTVSAGVTSIGGLYAFFSSFFFSLVTVCAKRALWGNCDWFDDKGKLLSVDRNVCRVQQVFSIFFTYVINLHNFYAKIRMSKGNEFPFRRTYSFYVDQVFESFHQFNK